MAKGTRGGKRAVNQTTQKLNIAKVRTDDLEPLTGSEKQIAWATTIRNSFVEDMNARLDDLNDTYKSALSYNLDKAAEYKFDKKTIGEMSDFITSRYQRVADNISASTSRNIEKNENIFKNNTAANYIDSRFELSRIASMRVGPFETNKNPDIWKQFNK